MKCHLAIVLFLAHNVLSSAKMAETCREESICSISDNCRCSNLSSPLPLHDTPQLISLTFDEAILDNLYYDLWKPLLFNRRNPDGNSIGATFYVPHEYTDYEHVQELYLQGFEIGVNSLTKNNLAEYWANADEETLTDEFGGQRTLLSTFANIPIEDVIGARAPQLQIEGDVLINAYKNSGVQYDNSWTSRSSDPLFPYTLDYLSTQECRSDTLCPRESHPGFWIVPINNILGNNSVECNALTNCNVYGTASEIAAWLLQQVQNVRLYNKAPMTFLIPSAWFRFIPNSFEGFQQFLDSLASLDDVFLVTQKQVLNWVKNPLPLAEFRTEVPQRSATCSPINCLLYKGNTEVRYMKSCISCPEVYPWLGNPLGKL